MDDVDLKIILLLMNNSRLTYREISDNLELSVNAVFKRVQNLLEVGIIQRFTARLKPYAINAIYVFIMGQSNTQKMDEVIDTLGSHENTWQIILSSRNYMYIGAILKNIHQLEPYTAFVTKITLMQTPKVGFLSGVQYISSIPYIIPKSGSMSYDKLDLEIIQSLHDDSRRPVSEIAEEIKSTSSTVRRRLNRLIDEGVIDLSIDFNPEGAQDIFALFQITVNPSVEKLKFAKYLNEKYHPNLFYAWTFSNLPNIIVCWVWTNNMKELNGLIDNMKAETIDSIIFDIMYKVLYFETWKEKILYK
jgi:DNA-binding Lrp family transcriptional regulator